MAVSIHGRHLQRDDIENYPLPCANSRASAIAIPAAPLCEEFSLFSSPPTDVLRAPLISTPHCSAHQLAGRSQLPQQDQGHLPARVHWNEHGYPNVRYTADTRSGAQEFSYDRRRPHNVPLNSVPAGLMVVPRIPNPLPRTLLESELVQPNGHESTAPTKSSSRTARYLPAPVLGGGHQQLRRSRDCRSDDDECTEDEAGGAESAQAKAAFKNFLRQFKSLEKEYGFEAARQFAESQLQAHAAAQGLATSPEWRVCLELADLLKRENRNGQAAKWYHRVVLLQPFASQGWLEYAKLEEERGHLPKCRVRAGCEIDYIFIADLIQEILLEGLAHCPESESLLVKALKHEERMGNLNGARALLARLQNDSVDRSWKTMLEGGLLEARAGNLNVARHIFKFLIAHVPWYGPVFNEAFRLEERLEEHLRATAVLERGLHENPRYGPLWFSALRAYERLARGLGDLSILRTMVKRALAAVPKELVWKVYFEYALVEERAGNVTKCRKAFASSAKAAPSNLIWKVWLAGARLELATGTVEAARNLLCRALAKAPRKMRSAVLLECSRLEEFAGEPDRAREILCKAKKETPHEWRVFLESVLLEIRAGELHRAVAQALSALQVHAGTGRLWAVLIHLHYLLGHESQQLQVFKCALQEVPKSGEVWCEGARIAMRRGNLKDARKFLNFAILFTPQYGDSFIESLRLELIEYGRHADILPLEQQCINADPNYGFLWLHCKVNALDGPKCVLQRAAGHFEPYLHWAGNKEQRWRALMCCASLTPLPPAPCLTQEDRWRDIFAGDPIKP